MLQKSKCDRQCELRSKLGIGIQQLVTSSGMTLCLLHVLHALIDTVLAESRTTSCLRRLLEGLKDMRLSLLSPCQEPRLYIGRSWHRLCRSCIYPRFALAAQVVTDRQSRTLLGVRACDSPQCRFGQSMFLRSSIGGKKHRCVL